LQCKQGPDYGDAPISGQGGKQRMSFAPPTSPQALSNLTYRPASHRL
jgi:hypothetical protein